MPNVKLIAKTQPLVTNEPTDDFGGDFSTYYYLSNEEFVSYVARISNPGNQLNTKTAGKLLKYLLDHGHVSPFEHTYVSFEITTTRDISRQLLRHRSLTFQEYSGRYSGMDLKMVPRECRLQDTKNRQNSLKNEDINLDLDFKDDQREVWRLATECYELALSNGIAKEQARALLPEGLTKTTLIATGNLRSWIFYLKQRLDKSTQKEHRLVAEAIRDNLKIEFPIISEALGW